MTAKRENIRATRDEASSLLAAALAQLDAIKRAQSLSQSPALNAAAGSARDAVASIRNAMESGNIDASTLASLSAGLNLGVDVSSLVSETAPNAATVSLKIGIASLEIHSAVERFSEKFFHKHIFDADVARHTHGAELEAFRMREEEDKIYIRGQLERHTPDGDLNASGRMQRYMLDANAHGAGDNPEFLKDWNELKAKTGSLRASMRAGGKSTDEYDRHIHDDVVAFLRAKGLSDEHVKQALAKSDDPLDAVKPYLGGDNASRKLANQISIDNTTEAVERKPVQVTKQKAQADPPIELNMDAMNAKLAAAGLDLSSPGTASSGHGLSVQKPNKSPDFTAR